MLDIWKRQPSPSHVGCRYQLTVGKARLGSRMVDALRYSRFLLFFSFYGKMQTFHDFIQRSSFFCKGQGPRPMEWELLKEVREPLAVGKFPLHQGLAPVAGGSSLASGATLMGWMQQQAWEEGRGSNGGEPGRALPPSAPEGSPESSLTWRIVYSKTEIRQTKHWQ